MNIKEYIESGIIESYVMGLASESERAEFEQYCAQYPELVAARRNFEDKLEAYASENAVPPPPEVKVKVLKAIKMDNSKSPVRIPGMLKFATAASIVLLIAMAYLYYQSQQENKDLSKTNDRLRDQMTTVQNTLDRIVQEQKVVSDPNTLVVNMVGTTVAPKSSANVYWDSASTNVYLVVKNMPRLPSDQQYQLWALIDSKHQPMDLGVFDATDQKVILKMKNTQKAQAFAITIEKKGGSPSPTLQKMQSLGKTLQTQ
ncbi:MAG TPA: anti-sigma factor [Puia sp.]|nr:anti-sigma factor [Puia sp.]